MSADGPSRRARRFAALFAALIAVSTMQACSDGESSAPTPLTREQATLMADVLYRNRESGGARFSLSTPLGPEGGTLTMSGEVDWTEHHGHALVATSTSTDDPLTEVWWSLDRVFERRPSLDETLIDAGVSLTASVIERPVDMERRRIDQLIALIVALASEQPENAGLIMQTEGSAFLRNDTLRGTDVEVLRYGERTIYWVDPVTGRMLRFEGTDESRSFPIVVDLLETGDRDVLVDGTLQVLAFDDLPSDVTARLTTSP